MQRPGQWLADQGKVQGRQWLADQGKVQVGQWLVDQGKVQGEMCWLGINRSTGRHTGRHQVFGRRRFRTTSRSTLNTRG